MLYEGQQVELTVEKPASGGRMIARHLGQIVLVRGAIPGERVAAWIERAEKRLAYAVDARGARAVTRPRIGGRRSALRWLALRAHRLRPTARAQARRRARRVRARRTPSARGAVRGRGSRTDGYRMRARLHVRGSRVGFYREGTHQLCDAAETGQLLQPSVAIVQEACEPSQSSGARRFDVDLDHGKRRRGSARHPSRARGWRARRAVHN